MSATGCGTIKKDGVRVTTDSSGQRTIEVDLDDGRTIKNNWDNKHDGKFDKRLASAKNNEGKKVCWSTWGNFPVDEWFKCICECKEK